MPSDAAHPQPPTQVDHADAHDHVRFDFEKLDCYKVALQFNTDRRGTIRLTSARAATRGERRVYEEDQEDIS